MYRVLFLYLVVLLRVLCDFFFCRKEFGRMCVEATSAKSACLSIPFTYGANDIHSVVFNCVCIAKLSHQSDPWRNARLYTLSCFHLPRFFFFNQSITSYGYVTLLFIILARPVFLSDPWSRRVCRLPSLAYPMRPLMRKRCCQFLASHQRDRSPTFFFNWPAIWADSPSPGIIITI